MLFCTLHMPLPADYFVTAHITHGGVGWEPTFYDQFCRNGSAYYETCCRLPSVHSPFKFVALCQPASHQQLLESLRQLGYEVTGLGDVEHGSGYRRVWFLIPHAPKLLIVGDGDYRVHQFNSEHFGEEYSHGARHCHFSHELPR